VTVVSVPDWTRDTDCMLEFRLLSGPAFATAPRDEGEFRPSDGSRHDRRCPLIDPERNTLRGFPSGELFLASGALHRRPTRGSRPSRSPRPATRHSSSSTHQVHGGKSPPVRPGDLPTRPISRPRRAPPRAARRESSAAAALPLERARSFA
jgi:hypothetical protein